MNHSTAINELTIIRDTQYNNAAVAHAEGRHDDRDRRLNKANDLSATIRELQGIREPELPGLETTDEKLRKTNPFFDRALGELKRDAWNGIGKPRAQFVPVVQRPDCGATVSVKSMLGVEEMPTPDHPVWCVVRGWFDPEDLNFVDGKDSVLTKQAQALGYQKATAHIFLDEPAAPAQP
jgi:hypothetical protein